MPEQRDICRRSATSAVRNTRTGLPVRLPPLTSPDPGSSHGRPPPHYRLLLRRRLRRPRVLLVPRARLHRRRPPRHDVGRHQEELLRPPRRRDRGGLEGARRAPAPARPSAAPSAASSAPSRRSGRPWRCRASASIAGPLVGALAGAGAGGAAGSLVGALVGAGIPEEHAKAYESDIKDGRIVVGAHPRDEDRDMFRDTYSQNGATNVYSSLLEPEPSAPRTARGGGYGLRPARRFSATPRGLDQARRAVSVISAALRTLESGQVSLACVAMLLELGVLHARHGRLERRARSSGSRSRRRPARPSRGPSCGRARAGGRPRRARSRPPS